jgi:hypothetical protein
MVWKTCALRPSAGQKGYFVPEKGVIALSKLTTLSIIGWGVAISLTLLLIGVPFVLAFLTAFYISQISISYRRLLWSTRSHKYLK